MKYSTARCGMQLLQICKGTVGWMILACGPFVADPWSRLINKHSDASTCFYSKCLQY